MSAHCVFGLASPLPEPPLSVVLLSFGGSAAAGRPVVGVVVGLEVVLLMLVLDLSVFRLRTVIFHSLSKGFLA